MEKSWLLTHVRSRIMRTRGGHSLRALLGSLETMDHATLRDLWQLLETIENDAASAGARKGAQQPWKRW